MVRLDAQQRHRVAANTVYRSLDLRASGNGGPAVIVGSAASAAYPRGGMAAVAKLCQCGGVGEEGTTAAYTRQPYLRPNLMEAPLSATEIKSLVEVEMLSGITLEETAAATDAVSNGVAWLHAVVASMPSGAMLDVKTGDRHAFIRGMDAGHVMAGHADANFGTLYSRSPFMFRVVFRSGAPSEITFASTQENGSAWTTVLQHGEFYAATAEAHGCCGQHCSCSCGGGRCTQPAFAHSAGAATGLSFSSVFTVYLTVEAAEQQRAAAAAAAAAAVDVHFHRLQERLLQELAAAATVMEAGTPLQAPPNMADLAVGRWLRKAPLSDRAHARGRVGGAIVAAAHDTPAAKRTRAQADIVANCSKGSAKGNATRAAAFKTPAAQRTPAQAGIVANCSKGGATRAAAFKTPAAQRTPAQAGIVANQGGMTEGGWANFFAREGVPARSEADAKCYCCGKTKSSRWRNDFRLCNGCGRHPAGSKR